MTRHGARPIPRFAPPLPLVRLLVLATLALGFWYLSWRYLNTINWSFWWIAVPLILAETYSYIDAWFFGLAMWRLRRRGERPPSLSDATVDVYITCYNEPVELVRETARAAKTIEHPCEIYILDDGSSPEMRVMAVEEGVGYIVRSTDWTGHERHAKSGNLNNALFQTRGEFILILDADQIPSPIIVDRLLGYFHDPKMAFVQSPQWFYNVPPGDPFGSQAPLFYGPIMQGKDGWNAAFFCGSNALLRREALMQLGISFYVRELHVRVRRALRTADRVLRGAESSLGREERESVRAALTELRTAVREAEAAIESGEPIQEVTWRFQRHAQRVSRLLVDDDLARIRAELAEIAGFEGEDIQAAFDDMLNDEQVLAELSGRAASPLMAIETVRNLLMAVERADEAQPMMPFATISVTEDMATAFRLHATGWRSAYHDEVLARGIAPEDLRTALQQRLRWSQGTIQVALRENPLAVRGLSLGQRLMYFATIWSYFSGFVAIVYLSAPVFYLIFSWLPVNAYSAEFFWHLLPYLAVNQLLFTVIGWGRPTWRGQQYSLALFPLWIKAVTSAVGNVWFGRKLGFVVTPKTRQGGRHFGLVKIQLASIALVAAAMIYGLTQLALGYRDDWFPVLVNVIWSGFLLAMLGAVIPAATYAAEEPETVSSDDVAVGTAAEAHGRALGGSR